ncbi:MAG: hypothetical protein FXF47_06515, partial [Candidatus Mcinerneyibacterium aminivorans]
MRKKVLIGMLVIILSVFIFAEDSYKKPPREIIEIFNNLRSGYMKIDNIEKRGAEINYRHMVDLKTISRKTVELAGEEISPVLNGPIEKYPYYDIKLYDFKKSSVNKINIDEETVVRDFILSPNNKKYAFSVSTDDGIKIYAGDFNSGEYKQIENIRLNDSFDADNFFWIDDKRLLIKAVLSNRKERPQKGEIPSSPVVEETKKTKSRMRTYTNLLKNEFDKKLFDYYFESRIVIYDTAQKKIKKIGSPGLYDHVSVSPNGKYILLEEVKRPYSYRVPNYYFSKDY